MLRDLSIHHFTLIEAAELSFQPGMTVITGETGAGKSLIVDALAFVLGARAETGMIYSGQTQMEVSAAFDISENLFCKQLLETWTLTHEDHLILRRTFNQAGRSRAWINGRLVTLAELRQVGDTLMNIHGQHEQQSLLHQEAHLELLDQFGHFNQTAQSVCQAYHRYETLLRQLTEKRRLLEAKAQERELLRYQVEEYETLALKPHETTQLLAEQHQLAHTDTLRHLSETVLMSLNDADNNVLKQLAQAKKVVQQGSQHHPDLLPITALLNEALINITESCRSLRDFEATLSYDPARLLSIEARLRELVKLADKHKVPLEHLPDHAETLHQRLHALTLSEDEITALETEATVLLSQYQEAAQQLSKARQNAAKKLEAELSRLMPQLGMPGGQFKVLLREHAPSAQGNERAEFQVLTNTGQAFGPLTKIASGGELSRISLALEVLANIDTTHTLIFDEVDVGISGKTAEKVGQLLKELSRGRQVLVITHLPQVAALGEQALWVEKHSVANKTVTKAKWLQRDERIMALAGMLSGAKITPESLKNAEALLQ